jgi:hypothetical protein
MIQDTFNFRCKRGWFRIVYKYILYVDCFLVVLGLDGQLGMDSRTLAPRCIRIYTFVLLYKHPIGALYILQVFGWYSLGVS